VSIHGTVRTHANLRIFSWIFSEGLMTLAVWIKTNDNLRRTERDNILNISPSIVTVGLAEANDGG